MIPEEREWQAQQRAMEAERNGQDAAELDDLAAGYVPIARALRRPLACGLPSDFAFRVAARAAGQAQSTPLESRLEQWLLTVLGSAMGVASLIVLLIYREVWLEPLTSILGQTGTLDSPWPVVLAGCLAVSWLADLFRRNLSSAHQRTA